MSKKKVSKKVSKPGFTKKPAIPMDGVSTIDLELARGTHKVVWEYIGEGWSGDYNPEDSEDTPLLRFSCYECDEHGFTMDADAWRQMDDASYCTRMPVGTPVQVLARAAGIILEAIEDVNYKKRLEELSWFCPDDFEPKQGRELSKDELATVLAALRCAQDQPNEFRGYPQFDDGARLLAHDQINDLCEDFNTGEIKYKA